ADPRLVDTVEETSYSDFLDRLRDGVSVLQAEGSWFHPHPWLNMFLPDDAVEELVSHALVATGIADLGPFGLILLYPLPSARFGTPLLRLPAGQLVWLFALLRAVSPGQVDVALRANAGLLADARSVGGCAYPTNAVPMTPTDWRTHLG